MTSFQENQVWRAAKVLEAEGYAYDPVRSTAPAHTYCCMVPGRQAAAVLPRIRRVLAAIKEAQPFMFTSTRVIGSSVFITLRPAPAPSSAAFGACLLKVAASWLF